jgi:hypothetical protein
MFYRSRLAQLVLCSLVLGGWTASTWGQTDAAQPSPAAKDRFELLAKTLSGSKLTGSFTVTREKKGELTQEEYHILECKKLDEGNLWMIQARIKYGQHDVTVPIPVPIEWAGTTPVISLDDFEIPLMGTFDAQVLFDLEKRQYAGTWSHGDVGGHLFGEIVPGKAEASSASKTPDDGK